ncbi:hypothetical protein COV20_01555 [Candidatus Woesearchaeota archaeon CG10_big_fil_rev_8_21_14_0_10_45_16]|nr:MAG: hypothetical protein COV20_01555 [Candidatus Woesearchaeota archaeon CG10_big_fil_rev_8_21_14_0_10_45_16]
MTLDDTISQGREVFNTFLSREMGLTVDDLQVLGAIENLGLYPAIYSTTRPFFPLGHKSRDGNFVAEYGFMFAEPHNESSLAGLLGECGFPSDIVLRTQAIGEKETTFTYNIDFPRRQYVIEISVPSA